MLTINVSKNHYEAQAVNSFISSSSSSTRLEAANKNLKNKKIKIHMPSEFNKTEVHIY